MSSGSDSSALLPSNSSSANHGEGNAPATIRRIENDPLPSDGSLSFPTLPPSYTPSDQLASSSRPALPRIDTQNPASPSAPPADPPRRARGYSLRTQLFSKNIHQNESSSPIELQPTPFFGSQRAPEELFGPNNNGMFSKNSPFLH